MLKLLEKFFATTEPVSKIPIRLEGTGAVQIDIGKYLSSDTGKAELQRIQEQWLQAQEKKQEAAE